MTMQVIVRNVKWSEYSGFTSLKAMFLFMQDRVVFYIITQLFIW